MREQGQASEISDKKIKISSNSLYDADSFQHRSHGNTLTDTHLGWGWRIKSRPRGDMKLKGFGRPKEF